MIRFSQAISDLAELERVLEENPEAPLDGFNTLLDNAKDAIDSRGMFLNALSSRIEELLALEAKIKDHRKRMESAKQYYVNQTMAFMRQHPGWDWQGDVHKLRIQKNGGKQAIVWAPFKEPVKVDRVVIAPADIPEEWLETQIVTTLRPGFEDALREGKVQCNSASVLPRGERLVVS